MRHETVYIEVLHAVFFSALGNGNFSAAIGFVVLDTFISPPLSLPPPSLSPHQPSLSGVKVLTVNCMSVTSPQALYAHLATQLQLEGGGRGKRKEPARERVLKHFTSSKKLM